MSLEIVENVFSLKLKDAFYKRLFKKILPKLGLRIILLVNIISNDEPLDKKKRVLERCTMCRCFMKYIGLFILCRRFYYFLNKI